MLITIYQCSVHCDHHYYRLFVAWPLEYTVSIQVVVKLVYKLLYKGYPNEGAAHVALETIRSWLEIEDHHEKVIF